MNTVAVANYATPIFTARTGVTFVAVTPILPLPILPTTYATNYSHCPPENPTYKLTTISEAP